MLALNQNPLNKRCGELLKNLKQEPNLEHLHSLQLALWLLERKRLPKELVKYRDQLLSHAQSLYERDQRQVQSLFLNPETRGLVSQVEEAAASLDELSAEAAATRLVENLYWNLALRDPALMEPVTE